MIHSRFYGNGIDADFVSVESPPLSEATAARLVGMAPGQLAAMRKDGTGPPCQQRADGTPIYHARSLLRWKESQAA